MQISLTLLAPYASYVLAEELHNAIRTASGRWGELLGWSAAILASVAPALAIPLETAGGEAFPHRDEIVFVAFGVIMATLR